MVRACKHGETNGGGASALFVPHVHFKSYTCRRAMLTMTQTDMHLLHDAMPQGKGLMVRKQVS